MRRTLFILLAVLLGAVPCQAIPPAPGGGGSSTPPSWGSISGTITNQTDLVNTLAGKENSGTAAAAAAAVQAVTVPDMSDTNVRTSAPASPVVGHSYIADCVNWDPASLKITKTASTIAFVSGSPATITDSGNGFVAAGFAANMKLKITGTASNNKTVTIANVAAGTLTLSTGDTLTSESAGTSFTLVGGYYYQCTYTDSGTYVVLTDRNGNLILNVSTDVKTMLNAADASAARTAIGAAPSANPTFTGTVTLPAPLVIGTALRFAGAVTVATIPAAPAANDVILVTDGASPCDVTTGSGSTPSWHRYTGSTWVCLGAESVSVGASKVVCTDSSGDPVACTNLTDEQRGKATIFGTVASPITTNPYSLTAANAYGFVLHYNASSGVINLPAGAAGMNGIIYLTSTNGVTIDPNGSEVVVRDGATQTGGVSFTLTGAAGNYVALEYNGSCWVTLGYKGTLAQGS